MMGSYIDRNPKMVKALIKGMAESITVLQTDTSAAKAVVRSVLRTDDIETLDYATMRSVPSACAPSLSHDRGNPDGVG